MLWLIRLILPLLALTSRMGAASCPITPLTIQPPAYDLGKQWGMSQVLWPLHHHGRPRNKVLAPGFRAV